MIELWLSQLHKLTVLWPAWLLTPEGRRAVLNRRVIWRITLTVIFVLALATLLHAFSADIAIAGAADVATYLDIVAIAWLAGAARVVRAGIELARRGLRRGGLRRPSIVHAPRAARSRRPRRPAPPPANDEDGTGWALAA
jgi:hypothetical protein